VLQPAVVNTIWIYQIPNWMLCAIVVSMFTSRARALDRRDRGRLREHGDLLPLLAREQAAALPDDPICVAHFYPGL
jgi:hypothetical protein